MAREVGSARLETATPVAFLLVLLACTPTGVVGVEGRTDASTFVDGAVADALDTGDALDTADASDDATLSRTAFCEGAGPPIRVGDTVVPAERACGGRLATRTFRYGICTCGDAIVEDSLSVDSFDAREGPFTSARPGGSLGVNGRYTGAAAVEVAGSMILGEGGLLTLSTQHVVGLDLRMRGGLLAEDDVSVGRDLVVGGDVAVSGSLRVARNLVAPSGALISEETEVGGERLDGTESTPAPCDCSVAARVDVGALVRGGLEAADNEALGVPRSLLTAPSDPLDVSLPCGRFVFDDIHVSDASVTLRIEGRTAIFVSGDALFEDDFTVDVGPLGELDLFVAGSLSSSAELRLGSPDLPSRVRVYVGGSAPIELAAFTELGGNLYAPNAELRPNDFVEVFGSVFVGALHVGGNLAVHYDTSVLAAGDECPRPEGIACAGCGDCPSGAACVSGLCEPCGSDSACCAPLFCAGGACLSAPF